MNVLLEMTGERMLGRYKKIILADDIMKEYTPSHIAKLTGCKPDTAAYNQLTSLINRDLCPALALEIVVDLHLDKPCTCDTICTTIDRILKSGCDLGQELKAVGDILCVCFSKDRIGTCKDVLGKMRGTLNDFCDSIPEMAKIGSVPNAIEQLMCTMKSIDDNTHVTV